MTKTNTIFLLTILLGCLSLHSQSYDFNNYKYRFQKLRGLSTEFNTESEGRYNNSKINYLNNTIPTIERESEPNSSFNGRGRLNYFQDVNTNKLQQYINAHIGIRKGFTRNNDFRKDNDTTSNLFKGNSNSLDLGFRIHNRFYNEQNNFFLLSGGGSIETSQQNGSDLNRVNGTIQESNKNSRNILNTNVNLSVGAGKGRLEYVTDPIMATFLIVDLIEKAGINGVSPEQIENIAKGITQIRNTRFLDFRFRLIDQIEMLDKVLKDNGITSEKAAKYYTTLNDNWLYATQLQRYSGERWEFALNSNLNTSNGNREEKDFRNNFSPYQYKAKYNAFNLRNGFDINYNNYKQSSLKVQKSWGLSLSGFQSNENSLNEFKDSIGSGTWISINENTEINNLTNNLTLEGNWSYLFQPNTRTFLTFTASPGIRLSSNKDETNIFRSQTISINAKTNQNNNSIFMNLGLRYFKFISQNLYFNININTYSNYRITDGETTIFSHTNSSSSSSKTKTNRLFNSYQLIASLNYLIF
jgi:hypothetical protein